jgi:hypothetical protein
LHIDNSQKQIDLLTHDFGRQVIHGGPSTVSAAVGPLETVVWQGEGQWKRSKTLFLLQEDCVWEWDVNSGQTRRTIRNTNLHLHLMPGDSFTPSIERAPSTGKSIGHVSKPSKDVAKQDNETARSNDSSDKVPFNRSSSSGNEVAPQRPAAVHEIMGSLRALNDILSLGIKEVTGMPMLRRESKGGPWLKREGSSPPPIHVTIDGMVPSLVDVMGQYTLVDESWADTDRPLYVNVSFKGKSPDMFPSIRRAPSGGGGVARVPSLGASSDVTRGPSGGSDELQGIANVLETISRKPSGGMLQVSRSSDCEYS